MVDIDPKFAACLQKARAIVSAYRTEAPMGCDPQNVVEIGPEWDPGAHDYEGTMTPGATLYVAGVMGLLCMSAFAMISVGAFFTYEAAAAAPTGQFLTYEITYTVVDPITGELVTATQLWCTNGLVLSEGQLAILASMTSQGIGGVSPVLVAEILEAWGLTKFSLDGLLALAAFNQFLHPYYGNFGAYLGQFLPGGGGFSDPPGFPGFPGGGQTVHHEQSWDCVIVDEEAYCHWRQH